MSDSWKRQSGIKTDAGTCGLEIIKVGSASTPEEALGLLPENGEGWVCLEDRILPFKPGIRDGFPISAEVTSGSATTTLRQTSNGWAAWTWKERPGTTHRFVRERYCSSAPSEVVPSSQMEYTTYWTQVERGEIRVWEPVGSRFSGWRD